MKTKAIIITFLVVMAFSVTSVYSQQTAAQPAQQSAQKKTQKFDVNFRNISMKEFITFVSSFTDINIVYNDNDLRGTVTISSQFPMSASDIMQIFYATLKINGLVPVQHGTFMRILPDKDVPNYDTNFINDVTGKPEDLVTTIINLKNYNAVGVANTLNRVKSRHGYVEPLRGTNSILIKDFVSRIDSMLEITTRLDSMVGEYQLYSIPLSYVLASKMEQQILKFFNDMLRNSITGNIPILLSDDLSNVLVILAVPDDFSKIEYLITRFDVKNSTEANAPRIFYLKNTTAEDVEKVLNKLLMGASAAPVQPGRPPQPGDMKANVSSDKSTNSIIAIGSQELYNNVATLIEKLDIPRKQVYVEALFLETSLDTNDSFGVEWFGAGAENNNFAFGNSKNSGALGSLIGSIGSGGAPDPSKLPGGFSAGLIGDLILYNGIKFPSFGAFISAIKGESAVNIVSNPQILTLDNQEAEVFVGENRPYVTSEKFDANNNPIQTFDYRNVGVRLKVTPHISGENLVTLDIEQEVNKISPATFAASAPITLTRTTKTKVQLYDRTIMVISGLMKDDASVGESGVPYLRKIPILGWLFKSRTRSSEKTNLMVFITTHIIDTHDDMQDVLEKRLSNSQKFNEMTEDFVNTKLGGKGETFIPQQDEILQKLDDIKTEKEQ